MSQKILYQLLLPDPSHPLGDIFWALVLGSTSRSILLPIASSCHLNFFPGLDTLGCSGWGKRVLSLSSTRCLGLRTLNPFLLFTASLGRPQRLLLPPPSSFFSSPPQTAIDYRTQRFLSYSNTRKQKQCLRKAAFTRRQDMHVYTVYICTC